MTDGYGFDIGRFWLSLFLVNNFYGFLFSIGINDIDGKKAFCFQFQLFGLQIVIGFDL